MIDTRGYSTPGGASWRSGLVNCCEFLYKSVDVNTPVIGVSDPYFTFCQRSTNVYGLAFSSSTATAFRNSDGAAIGSDTISVNTDITSAAFGEQSHTDFFVIGTGYAQLPAPRADRLFPYSNGIGSYVILDGVLSGFTPGDSMSISITLSRLPGFSDYSGTVTWSGWLSPLTKLGWARYVYDRISLNADGTVNRSALPAWDFGNVSYDAVCGSGYGGIYAYVNTRTGTTSLSGVVVNIGGSNRLTGRTYRKFNNGVTGTEIADLVNRCQNVSVPCEGAEVMPPDLSSYFDLSLALPGLKEWFAEFNLELNQSCPP
jgi:hypothetical protein